MTLTATARASAVRSHSRRYSGSASRCSASTSSWVGRSDSFIVGSSSQPLYQTCDIGGSWLDLGEPALCGADGALETRLVILSLGCDSADHEHIPDALVDAAPGTAAGARA